ncbi:M36 family metallopeptidase [Streptomyces platensis]|uniref:M36 family metallopeptidase n=1 Tax=Streptomyces platensis TaxID=58346 RepID=UPI001F1E632D|nr:M36 family metallopeptidase [Streptomyces platensis]MCF3143928.1 M36 family metallopeptidase [Streptomyces platensis]
MSVMIDKRNKNYDRLASVAEADAFLDHTERVAAAVDHTLVADRSKVNRFTGHLTELRVAGAPAVTGLDESVPIPDTGYIAQAKRYVTSVAEAIGFAAGEPAEFEADPNVMTTSEGLRVVSLQQVLNGIEVWAMAPKVWLYEDGTVDRVIGDTVSAPANLPSRPTVPAEVALRVAAAKAAEPTTLRGVFGDDELPRLDISAGFERLSHQARNDQPMTFGKGPFEEAVPARLVYLYMGDDARLTWMFTFSREKLAAQYHAFVEADERTRNPDEPEILYFYDTVRHAVAGRVFQRNPAESTFDTVPFPLPTDGYPTAVPSGLPAGFPLPWAETHHGKISTEGNNVRALNGTTRRPVEVIVDDAGNSLFDPAEDSPEQFVTNIFYFCNFAHDLFMMLGFTEDQGNFQTTNITGLGQGADPVRALAHPGAVFGTANMATRADGLEAVMNMGLVTGTGRHTADDFDVVLHEFCHGVSNRLVGGLFDANGLEEDQSVAMGEGWGDYFALTTRNFSNPEERAVVGNWVVNQSQGIRQRPYDSDYPGTFGDIGKGPGEVAGAGNGDLTYQEVHDVGEIWCAALMELTRKVTTALNNKERGYQVTWQAVVDGMKLTPKNPSFLVARDAILRAFKAMKGGLLTSAEYTKVRKAAWQAFARFEMGFDAFCPNATFTGCRGGTAMPPAGHED